VFSADIALLYDMFEVKIMVLTGDDRLSVEDNTFKKTMDSSSEK